MIVIIFTLVFKFAENSGHDFGPEIWIKEIAENVSRNVNLYLLVVQSIPFSVLLVQSAIY